MSVARLSTDRISEGARSAFARVWPTHQDERTWRRGLLLIVLAAALARLALILATPHFSPWGDPADFQRIAASIAAGHGFPTTGIASPGTPSAFRPPGYPFLLGAAYAIAGTHLLVGRLLSALLGVVVVILTGYLGRALWGRRVGLLAAAMAALFLPLIALNGSLVSEALFLPLELALALCLLALSRSGGAVRWALLAGVICGAAAMTRTVGILWAIPCVAVLATTPTGRRARARSLGALALALVLVLTPWAIRNAEAFHAFVPLNTESGYTLAGEYNADAGEANSFRAVWRVPLQVKSLQRMLLPLYLRRGGINESQLDSALRGAALSYIGRHPGDVAVAVWLGALRMFDLGLNHGFVSGVAYHELGLPGGLRAPTDVSVWLVVLVILGGAIARATGRIRLRAGPWWIWSLPLIALAATVPVSGTPRYRAPADPFLLLLAALILSAALSTWLTRPQAGPLHERAGSAIPG